MSKIYILIEGGVIQSIHSDKPDDITVVIEDRDPKSEEPVILVTEYKIDYASRTEIKRWEVAVKKEMP